VKALLAAGTPVNAADAQGRTALIVAVQNRQAATAKALVSAGADLNREARAAGSALNIAENNGDTELAAWLLAAGAHSTGKSVGDTVCVRSWGGEGFCGQVKAFTVKSVQIAVTSLVGCANGCPARQECSAELSVGGTNGLQRGDAIAVPSWCLTQTGVKQ
jgi:ankyrin repeat protein